MRPSINTVVCLAALLGSAVVCKASEYTLEATCTIISGEPAMLYHTGGIGVKADVMIGSTNSYSCVNMSGRTLSPYLTWTANIGIEPDPVDGDSGFSAPTVTGNKQVTLDNNEGWSLNGVLAGTTEPLAIGTYDCDASADLTEQKTGQSALNPQLLTGITVEV